MGLYRSRNQLGYLIKIFIFTVREQKRFLFSVDVCSECCSYRANGQKASKISLKPAKFDEISCMRMKPTYQNNLPSPRTFAAF